MRDAPSGSAMVRFLEETLLRTNREMFTALFTYDTARGVYSLFSATGFSDAAVALARERFVYRLGEARGHVGLVAARREALYLPDAAEDPNWKGRDCVVQMNSCYYVPVIHGDEVPIVVCFLSPRIAAFNDDQLAQLDWFAGFAGRVYEFEAALRAKVANVDRGVRDVGQSLGALRTSLQPEAGLQRRRRAARDLRPRVAGRREAAGGQAHRHDRARARDHREHGAQSLEVGESQGRRSHAGGAARVRGRARAGARGRAGRRAGGEAAWGLSHGQRGEAAKLAVRDLSARRAQ